MHHAAPALPDFADAAAELRQQEIARLKDALIPRLEALRSMTAPAFRSVIADMLDRFGHTIVTDPNTADFVTTKNGRKFVTASAAKQTIMDARR